MFPQIAKRKKKQIPVSDKVYRQWEEISKDLDHRAKLGLKKIPNGFLHDFSKVCRIKSIPQFYANYFIAYSYKHSQEELNRIFEQQAENMLTHQSHFHIISKTIKEREDILNSIREALVVVEGFMLMNEGKNVPLATKGVIEEIVKGCQTLEELRQLEKQKTQQLGNKIIQLRQNAVKLLNVISKWRLYLENLSKGEASYAKKVRIIYPHQAINALLLIFYDSYFIRTSYLKSEVSFGKEQDDPFLQKVGRHKRGGQIQQNLCQVLKSDTTDYRELVKILKGQMPSDQSEQTKEKELYRQRQQEIIKSEKLKEQKMKDQRLKAMRQEKDKKAKMQRYSSFNNLKGKKGESEDKGIRYKTSRGIRSQKKIINVDNLKGSVHRKGVQKQKQVPNKDDLKIIGVYQKGHSRPIKGHGIQNSMLSQRQDQIYQQKKIWQKQIKEEQAEKEKMKRLLQQTEKRAIIETKQFQEKLKRYQEEVANLKGKVDNKRTKRNLSSSEIVRRSPMKNEKKSIVNVYGSSIREVSKGANTELLESRLEQQSRMKRNLELQIKELGKEKLKLEKQLEKQSSRISKESNLYQKKLEKYEELIHKLKNDSEHNKKMVRQLQNSHITEQKKASENLRMYAIKEKEDQLKKKLLQKIQQRQNRKRLKESRIEAEAKRREHESQKLQRSKSISERSLDKSLNRDLQIVKTKQTIEIVFEAGSRRSRKSKKDPISKQLIEAQHKLDKLEKQRELLERKLEMSHVTKDEKRKVYESKIGQQEYKVDRVRQQLEKQRDRNHKLEENIRKMRKSINSEFELRLNKQRIKFERQKEQLLKVIQKEKDEKQSRDKILEQQMKFLKQMQKNEQELMRILDRQRRQKKQKQRILAEQLQKKEQLMSLMQIQEIKKTIQRQVRRQLLESQEQDEEDILFKERKAQMEQEIQKLRNERDNEISQLDEQNENLKDLISRIKSEQTHLLYAIRQNIDLQSEEDTDQLQQHRKHKVMSSHSNKTASRVQVNKALPQNNNELMQQLKKKTMLQYQSEQKKRQHYSDIQNSSFYKDKEKVQNLVQFYLQSPHEYPGQKKPHIDKKEKEKLISEMQQKSKLIQQFQTELFSVKDLPEFIPTMKNDSINTHLLNLREAYQDYEVDALRRELFPPLREEVYNERQLSVQSQEAPIETMMDDVRAHEKKHSPKKKEDKKNFLSINRMRLMLLEDNRKQKQREIIEEEGRKKVQRMQFEANRKKREEKMERKRKKQQEQKQKKRQEMEENIKSKKKFKVKADKRQKSEHSQHSKKIKETISDISDISRNSSFDTKNIIISKSKKSRSQHEMSDSESEKQKNISSDIDKPILQSKKSESKVENDKKSEIQEIKEQKVEHSMDQKQQQQFERTQRALLKSELKSIQSEVRSYISGEQQFTVYQQFVNEEELQTYIQKLLELSADDVKKLNGNDSLKTDAETYCTMTVLVAKNRKGIQIGVGVFHKEYDTGQYICDYILTHKMSDFLNLIFNFSRHIYSEDKNTNKIEFIFDLKYIEDQQTMLHFLQFEKKARRLGQVYIKTKNSKERKYILKRSLFQDFEESKSLQSKGVELKLNLLVFDDVMMEINEGFQNPDNLNHTSLNLILAYYLSKNPELLSSFKAKAENELNYRQLLVTSLLFNKKQLQIKAMEQKQLGKLAVLHEMKKISQRLDIGHVQTVQQMKINLVEKLPSNVKRCILEVGYQQIGYLIFRPQEAVNRVQSSNSSQTALFLSIIPKYKLMIIEAQQYLSMSASNPQLTAYFYIKHFIKNIVDVRKQVYQRIYLPQMKEEGTNYYKDVSRRLGNSVILQQSMKLGWKQAIGNSLIFTPKHRDLVIQKPFIIAVLSGAVERAVEGSPIALRVVM